MGTLQNVDVQSVIRFCGASLFHGSFGACDFIEKHSRELESSFWTAGGAIVC